MLKTLYLELGKELGKNGVITSSDLLDVNSLYKSMQCRIETIPWIVDDFKYYLSEIDYPLTHREDMEFYHYEKLFNTLVHSLGENYYYLKENPKESRRIIATSTDCISVIQCRGVDWHTLSLNVFMRSSHYTNLLPVDLIFLIELVPRYIEAAKKLEQTFKPDWGTFLDDVDNMELNISFGSLHTNIKNLL